MVPAVDLSTGSGPPGTVVTARGAGFGSLESGITLNFSGPGPAPFAVDRVVASGMAADVNGSWTANFVVPDGPAGSYGMIVNAGGAAVLSVVSAGPPVRSGVVVTTGAFTPRSFNMARVLRLIPDRAAPGATVYLLGRGFATTSAVTIKLDEQVMTTNPAALTTGVGAFFLGSFTVPATGVSYGAHEVTATDAGGGSATAQLTVARSAIIQLTPKYGIPGDTIAVTGSGFNGSALVDFSFDGTSFRTTPEAVITAGDGSFTASFQVPERSAPGYHRILATDMYGENDSADFTVQAPPVRAVP